MKVCFVSFEYPPNVIGGAGTYAETLVDGLRSSGVDAFVITRGDLNDYSNKTYRIPTPNMSYLRRLFFIRPAIDLLNKLNKIWKFDVVHFNEPHIIPRKPDLPTVCTFHSAQINELQVKLSYLKTLRTGMDIKDLVLKSPIGTICDIFTAHVTDKIICPSPHLTKLIKSHYFVEDEKVSFIPNGINLSAFDRIDACDTRFLSNYDLKRDNYLLYMGRLTAMKGIQYLVEAFRAIKKEYANLKLVIVGTGESEAWLKNLAHGTEDIVFLGYIDSDAVKKLLYDNCLAVAVPSLYEGLPMVVLEAMACRKAVVASDVGGIPFLIEHSKNGFLAKPRDSKGLEKSFRILLEDPNLRESMGSFGRKLIEKEFTIDKTVSETLKVYESFY